VPATGRVGRDPLDRGVTLLGGETEIIKVGELPRLDTGLGGNAPIDEPGTRAAERAVAVEQEGAATVGAYPSAPDAPSLQPVPGLGPCGPHPFMVPRDAW